MLARKLWQMSVFFVRNVILFINDIWRFKGKMWVGFEEIGEILGKLGSWYWEVGVDSWN